ncbi:P-type conjugative transfer protein TrbL [Novosphingobium malaysiense]|uniref:Conjugal transfer protein TrbL n=1 Tax=Novosphingobium malaysiense TaxID=1348853 RepID=A0A0B1ZS37_9SPHN|nr:P-type conjugative transfer protein TrbL [Novosphingobium malaysiense]KHK92053.1 conjugal transfer protein TrbL [Novosphingobium malaysiense]
MTDLNVIDGFLAAFIAYIDSGFGLLGGDVRFLTSVLIGIDITLAGLFWAMGGEDDVLARFIRKVLYVGAFALILNRFQTLSGIIFRSFAGLGLTAGGSAITADDLLRPGKLAATGFTAAWPLLQQASDLVGPVGFFENFVQIAVLVIAWIVVIVAFFILAVQLFVTILEFKLTSLAGFVLVPFALWNRSAFLAERVLGSVITSGIKVMVLAVIVGIGSNYFDQFTSAIDANGPDINQAVSLMLASLALFGLGIFGPSIASGLVAGAPQLGAGSAMASSALAAGGIAMGGAGAISAARSMVSGGLGAVRAGTAMGSAASAAYSLGQETAGLSSLRAGLGGMASTAKSAAASRIRSGLGLGAAAEAGRQAAWRAGDVARASQAESPQAASADAAPAWARKLQAAQTASHRRQAAIHTLRDGERGGASANPDIQERE